ncbi:MAG: hypothetical protein HKN76_18550 [Saprospiraceae bacterium]|nr:hypothetical protein [Saprospiraceae bacterium]
MTRNCASSLAALSLLITISACKPDKEEAWDGKLSGRWELNWAQVNDANTDRLRNLYFVFLPDTSMQSNILGSEANFKYKVTGDVITQLGNPELHYKVINTTDTTMTIETEIRGSTFTIYLDKAKPKVPIPAQ